MTGVQVPPTPFGSSMVRLWSPISTPGVVVLNQSSTATSVLACRTSCGISIWDLAEPSKRAAVSSVGAKTPGAFLVTPSP